MIFYIHIHVAYVLITQTVLLTLFRSDGVITTGNQASERGKKRRRPQEERLQVRQSRSPVPRRPHRSLPKERPLRDQVRLRRSGLPRRRSRVPRRRGNNFP